MTAHNTETEDTHVPAFHFWGTLWAYLKPYRKHITVAVICSFLVGIGVALQPMVIKFIVDEGINREGADPSERVKYSLLFVGLYLFMGAFRIGVWMIGYRGLIASLESVLFDVRSQLFRHVQQLCFRFHDQVSSGEIFNYIMGSPIVSLKTFLQQFSLFVPYQLVSWVVALTALVFFDWKMTIVLLLVVSIIVYVNHRSHKVIKVITADFMREESNVSKYVADMLRGCREIKIHAIEDRVSDSFDSQIDRIRGQSYRLTIQQQIEGIKPEGIQYIGMSVIYAIGVYSCVYGELTIGELFAFVSSVGLIMQPLMMFLRLNLVKANAEAGLERIVRVLETDTSLDEKPETEQVTIARADALSQQAGVPLIEFRDVAFSYRDNPVLHGINCSIEHGSSVALVGPSGSGKSTFVRLILRLYEIQKGRIRVNGRDIREFSLQDLRSNFGVVSQDTFLFQSTVYENIRVAHPEASEQDIQRAMEMAYVTEFLEDLPDGIETQVGENGFSLSGGQKQRVAIARAMIGNPRYYIFDEATSALDNRSERRVQQAMDRLQQDHTIITIAHRLSTVRNSDRILVFYRGQIVQEGTYEHLAQTPGLFKTLIEEGQI